MKKFVVILFVFLFLSCEKQTQDGTEGVAILNETFTPPTERKSLNEEDEDEDEPEIVLSEDIFIEFEDLLLPYSGDITQINEVDAAIILNPLILKGDILYDELMAQIINTPEWDSLTQAEKTDILNFTDEDKTVLALVYNSALRYQINWEHVRSCANFALGIAGIDYMIRNTRALGTVQGVSTAMKLIAGRYLGYIGIALMLYDFMDCLAGPEIERDEDGLVIIEDDIAEHLPTEIVLSSFVYYIDNLLTFDREVEPADCPVYFDSLTNIYFSDPSFQTILRTSNYLGAADDDLYRIKYYRIENGILTNSGYLYY